MDEGNKLHRGVPVFSQDGIALGAVGEVRGRFVSITPVRPNERPYWLPVERLATAATTGRVVADFDYDRLADNKAGAGNE